MKLFSISQSGFENLLKLSWFVQPAFLWPTPSIWNRAATATYYFGVVHAKRTIRVLCCMCFMIVIIFAYHAWICWLSRGLIILILSYNSNYKFFNYLRLLAMSCVFRLFDLRIEIEHQCSSEFWLFQFKRLVFYYWHCVHIFYHQQQLMAQQKYKDLVKSLQVDKRTF